MPHNPLNPRVEYVVGDVLRMEVETANPDPATGLVNLVQNPSPTQGVWWWTTPSSRTQCIKAGTYFRTQLNKDGGSGPIELATGYMAVEDYDYLVARFELGAITAGRNVKAWFEYSDINRAVVSTASITAALTTAAIEYLAPAYVPAAARYVRVMFALYNGAFYPNNNERFDVREVMVSPVSIDDGAPAEFDFVEPYKWTDVLDSCTGLIISRATLNVGIVNATLTDPALDPSVSSVLETGRRFRVTAYATPPAGGPAKWEPIFVGRIAGSSVAYIRSRGSAPLRPLITLTAYDALTELGNCTQPIGVATASSLQALFEGSSVPFDIQGRTSVGNLPATRVSYNPSASLVDQVATYRDVAQSATPGLHAMVSRAGVLTLTDEDSYAGLTIDDGHYSDVTVGYDTRSLINTVSIKWLRDWSEIGDAQQAVYGPFIYQRSVSKYGAASATFTLHGEVESYPAIKAFAANVLAANAEPRRQVTAMTVPVVNAGTDITRAVHIDVGNRLDAATDVLTAQVRVDTITHRISPRGWLVDYTFVNPDALPTPQQTPSPAEPGTVLDDVIPPPDSTDPTYPGTSTYPSAYTYPTPGPVSPPYPSLATYPPLYPGV